MADSGSTTVGPNSASGRLKVAECDYDLETGVIQFMFKNAAKDVIEVNINQFPSKIVQQAALRGIMESCRDTYAGTKGDVEAAKALCQARVDQLLSGEWRKAGEGAGAEGQGALWVEAVAKMRNWSVPEARQKLFDESKVTDEMRKQIRLSPKVQAIVAEIRLAKAQEALAKSQAAAGGAPDGDSVLDSI